MNRRNVLFVMTDQQHFRTLGCHGVPEARTPNIDRLAAGGLDFHNHIVSNPVCSPSRGSIITGRYLTENGLWSNGTRLPLDAVTIPRVMAAAGFQTAHFGKLHLVPIVNRLDPHPDYGFQTIEVAEGDQQLTHDAHFGWLRQTDPDLFVRYLTEMYANGHVDGYKSLLPEAKHHTTWTTQRAIDWLQHRRSPSDPFYLSVGYFDPHHAFNPVEPYASMYDEIDVADPVFVEGTINSKPAHYGRHFEGCRGATRDPLRMRAILRAYHAMCAHIDHNVGLLIRALEQLGLADDTAIVFTSDHGEFAGNHGLLWKGPYMLDDLLRVPLVVSIPGRPMNGQVVHGLSSAVDLMSTVQHLAGITDVDDASGSPMVDRDLRPFPRGPREWALAEWEHPKTSLTSNLRCLRTSQAKLVRYENQPADQPTQGELYDLEADPLELSNQFHNPEYAALRESLTEQLESQIRPRPTTSWEGAW